jgi:formylglycine-generating enzyme
MLQRESTRSLGLPTGGFKALQVMVSNSDITASLATGVPVHEGTVWVPGGTFRMGSNKHYPEEAPAHHVTVDGFWIDRTPVTNRQFKEFVRATGHKTFAESAPDPKNYPGTLPQMLFAGSLVFTPPNRPVDLRNWGEWWTLLKGADWRHPYGRKSNVYGLDNHPVVHVTFGDAHAYATCPSSNALRQFATLLSGGSSSSVRLS